jgi:iron complex outermembrane receptor protein
LIVQGTSRSWIANSNQIRRQALCSGIALAAIAMHASPVLAQTVPAPASVSSPAPPADEQTIGEIVVTAPRYVPQSSVSATKMDTPLIETPQSITVINRDQIDLLNVHNLGQAVRYTAGIVGENYGEDERYDWLTLRGFNPVQYIDGLQAPVGSVSNSGVDLYGSQAVEILKGPASVLYGLAPPGGIVNMVSRRPEDKFGGEVQLLGGSYNDKQISGDVTGAVTDHLSLGLTALLRDRGTQTDGVHSVRDYVAPAATWHINADTNLTLLSYYQWDQLDGEGGGFLPAAGIYSHNPVGPITSSMNLGDYAYNRFVHRQYGVGYDFTHRFNDHIKFEQNLKYFDSYGRMLDVYGAGLATTTTPGSGLYPYLNPLTDVQETDPASGRPLYSDYRTVNRYNFPFSEAIHSFNVDNRLTGAFDTGSIHQNVLLGLDYRRYIDLASFGFSVGPSIDLFTPNHYQAITTPALHPYTDQSQTQIGLYGQDELRYQRWVLTLTGRQDWVNSVNFGAPQNDQKFSYRVGLNYIFPIGVAPYISYATSFMPTPGSDANGVAFKPTTGNQVEGGIKYEPTNLGRGVKLLSTLAVYDIQQNNVLETDDANPNFQVQTGHVEVKGVELEVVARIYERLSLNGSYSYTESQVNTAPVTQLTLTPKHKLSLFADYTFQTGVLAGLGGGLGYRYISSTYGDTANQWQAPGYGLFDATLHYDLRKWRIAVQASNLFDKTYISQCSSEADCFYGLRRNVVATLTLKF